MSADQLVTYLFNVGVAVSIIATVLALGMSYSVAELVAPLRRVWLVALMVFVNSLLVPAVAWGIAKALPIDDGVAGMTLAVLGAASAAGLKAAQLAGRADLALAVSLVVVLQLANLVAVPVWAGQVVSGALISATPILGNLLLLVLIPLAIGLLVLARYAGARGERAGRAGQGFQPRARDRTHRRNPGRLADDRLAVGLLGGTGSALTAIVSVALGALVGRSSPETRTTTGVVSGLRFGSVGLIIIGTRLDGTPTIWVRRSSSRPST